MYVRRMPSLLVLLIIQQPAREPAKTLPLSQVSPCPFPHERRLWQQALLGLVQTQAQHSTALQRRRAPLSPGGSRTRHRIPDPHPTPRNRPPVVVPALHPQTLVFELLTDFLSQGLAPGPRQPGIPARPRAHKLAAAEHPLPQ